MRVIRPVTDFREHQRLTIQHDEVDLSHAAMEIPLHRFEAAPMQKRFGQLLPFFCPKIHAAYSFCEFIVLCKTAFPYLELE